MSCGNCTVCCNILRIDEINKPAHVKCSNCSGTGCRIHNESNYPKACSSFECAYVANNWSKKLRPDKCGVMIYNTIDEGYKAVRFRKKVSPAIVQQIEFIKQNYGIEIEGVDGRKVA